MKNRTTWLSLGILLLGLTAWAAGYREIPNGLKIGTADGTPSITLEENGDIVASGSITASSFIGAGSGSTFGDSTFRVQDNGDATKQIAFEASAIATGTTRTITMPNANVNLGDIATNNAKATNATHTGDVTGSTVLTIAAGAVDIPMINATGTPDSTTFLGGDGVWRTPAGSGDMSLAGVQTVTGAKSFNDAKLILNGSTSGTTTLKANATAGSTTATFPAASGTVAYTADIPVDTDDLSEGAANRYVSTGDETKLGYLAVTQPVNLDAMETDLATLLGGPSLGSFSDAVFAIVDNGDATKRGLFQASGITTATDRTYTMPDASGTLALTSGLHSAATVSGSYDYITLSGQDFVRGQIDLTTDVTGVLPDGNVSDTLTASKLVGSGSTTDAVDLGTAEVAGTVPYTKGGSGLTTLGTANQVLRTNSGATAVEWATMTGGDPTYGSHASASDNTVYVDATNQVGIGTTTPGENLEIYATDNAPRLMFRYYSMGSESVGPNITGAGSTTGSGQALVSAATQMQTNDGVYASANNLDASNQVTQFFVAKSFALAIPNGATIVGIKFTIEGKYEPGDGGQGYDADVYAIKANTHQAGYDHSSVTQWPTSDTARDYGGAADMWSNTWTEAEVESTGFGVAISITLAPTDMFYIDYISATVYYTTVSGDYTWTSGVDTSDGAYTLRANATDQMRMAYTTGDTDFTGIVNANGYKQDGVLYDLSTFGAGTGDVVGPASATDTGIPVYNGTTGKLIKNSTVLIDASGNVTLGTANTVDGRELSTDGAKLDGIEAAATADQTNAEIETAYNNQVAVVSQATAEAGSSTTVTRWTPQRVGQAIAALAVGDIVGPITSVTDGAIVTWNGTSGNSVQNSAARVVGTDLSITTVNGYTIPVGYGTVATVADTQTLVNKRITPRVGTTSANSATPTINLDGYDLFKITGQTATITSMTSGLTATLTTGEQRRIQITGTAAVPITWGASFASGVATLPTTTVTTQKLCTLFEFDGTVLRCMATGSY